MTSFRRRGLMLAALAFAAVLAGCAADNYVPTAQPMFEFSPVKVTP